MDNIQISFYNTPTLQYSNAPRQRDDKKLEGINLLILSALTWFLLSLWGRKRRGDVWKMYANQC